MASLVSKNFLLSEKPLRLSARQHFTYAYWTIRLLNQGQTAPLDPETPERTDDTVFLPA